MKKSGVRRGVLVYKGPDPAGKMEIPARFKDVSYLVFDTKGRVVGILPAAVNPSDPTEIVSHPGITYGGMIRGHRLGGNSLVSVFETILDTYRGQGFRSFLYKPVPRVYQVVPSEDDLYALFRLGAERSRCDLSAAIDLDQRQAPSKRRKRGFKKAEKSGIVIQTGFEHLEAYWRILSDNLSRRHNVSPVHTVEEMLELASRFPGRIVLVTGSLNAEPVAGTVLFRTRRTAHTQYLASSDLGRETCALEYVIEHCIRLAVNEKKRYFSFGVSSESDGKVLNESLHDFKIEFGGGGIVHEFYRINL